MTRYQILCMKSAEAPQNGEGTEERVPKEISDSKRREEKWRSWRQHSAIDRFVRLDFLCDFREQLKYYRENNKQLPLRDAFVVSATFRDPSGVEWRLKVGAADSRRHLSVFLELVPNQPLAKEWCRTVTFRISLRAKVVLSLEAKERLHSSVKFEDLFEFKLNGEDRGFVDCFDASLLIDDLQGTENPFNIIAEVYHLTDAEVVSSSELRRKKAKSEEEQRRQSKNYVRFIFSCDFREQLKHYRDTNGQNLPPKVLLSAPFKDPSGVQWRLEVGHKIKEEAKKNLPVFLNLVPDQSLSKKWSRRATFRFSLRAHPEVTLSLEAENCVLSAAKICFLFEYKPDTGGRGFVDCFDTGLLINELQGTKYPFDIIAEVCDYQEPEADRARREAAAAEADSEWYLEARLLSERASNVGGGSKKGSNKKKKKTDVKKGKKKGRAVSAREEEVEKEAEEDEVDNSTPKVLAASSSLTLAGALENVQLNDGNDGVLTGSGSSGGSSTETQDGTPEQKQALIFSGSGGNSLASGEEDEDKTTPVPGSCGGVTEEPSFHDTSNDWKTQILSTPEFSKVAESLARAATTKRSGGGAADEESQLPVSCGLAGHVSSSVGVDSEMNDVAAALGLSLSSVAALVGEDYDTFCILDSSFQDFLDIGCSSEDSKKLTQWADLHRQAPFN